MSLPSAAFGEAVRTDTPTRFDLARWLFLAIEERTGRCQTRQECLELMYEVAGAIAGPEQDPPRRNPK